MVSHPGITWAQRGDVVLVTVQVTDSKDLNVRLVDDTLALTCDDAAGQHWAVNMPLFGGVVAEESSFVARPRQIELKLQKKQSGEWWPRLQKASGKNHHVQIDWPRWKDEEDLAEEDAGFDLGGFGMDENADVDNAKLQEYLKQANPDMNEQGEGEEDDMPPLA